MRSDALKTISRLLSWCGLVFIVFAMNGNLYAHEMSPRQHGVPVHVSASAGSVIDLDGRAGGHEAPSTQHKCGHHSSGGCGQWAFAPDVTVLPSTKSIAWSAFVDTPHDRGALMPLDHPPKTNLSR